MSELTDRAIAAALQRVLLPPGLPDVESWAVATLYEPAGETVLVGGDFYDWFALPNGNLLFFIGDVSGKGPLAGALGMSIRKALKGISWVVKDIVAALPALQEALADEFHEAFATLCLVELTPQTGQVRLLLAGHPPPWLRADGAFREVVAPPNGMLGPRLNPTWNSVDLVLAPGDMLVLFSDGLTEARMPDGSQFGEGAFQDFLRQLPVHLSSYETVLRIDAHVRGIAAALTDDVIIGVLTFRPASSVAPTQGRLEQVVGLRLSAEPSSVSLARGFANDTCQRWEVAPEGIWEAELVVSELVTNAVLSAQSAIELRLLRAGNGVRVEVLDAAPAEAALDELALDSDPLLEHGRGLHLVRRLASDFGVIPNENGRTVWAVTALSRPVRDNRHPASSPTAESTGAAT